MSIFFKYITLLFVFLAPPNLAAQTLELPIEVSLLKAVIIDMEADFSVKYDSSNLSNVIAVSPDINNNDNDGEATRPAIVRITGGGAEALIDVETSNIRADDIEGSSDLRLFDFKIIDTSSGLNTIVMPDAKEDSFLLSIGGKVNGLKKDNFYTSVNILNINYL